MFFSLFCASVLCCLFFFSVRNEDGRILSGRVTGSGIVFQRALALAAVLKVAGRMEDLGSGRPVKRQEVQSRQGSWIGEEGTVEIHLAAGVRGFDHQLGVRN